MPDALLRPLIYLLIAGGLFASGWLTGCNYGSRELAKFKVEANALLESTKAENARKEAHDKQLAEESTDSYKLEIAKRDTLLATALASPRLRDTGARCVAPAKAPANPGATQPETPRADVSKGATGIRETEGVELSEEFDAFLKKQASKADVVAVWANSCYRFLREEDE